MHRVQCVGGFSFGKRSTNVDCKEFLCLAEGKLGTGSMKDTRLCTCNKLEDPFLSTGWNDWSLHLLCSTTSSYADARNL